MRQQPHSNAFREWLILHLFGWPGKDKVCREADGNSKAGRSSWKHLPLVSEYQEGLLVRILIQ